MFLWLTGRGHRIGGVSYRIWRPNPTMAEHIEAVTDVRLLLERERKLGSWTCERELARACELRSERRPHLPDGLLARL